MDFNDRLESPFRKDLTPNWDQGTGHLRWTEQVYDATIPAGTFTAVQIEAAVYKDLASFKYFEMAKMT